MNVGRVLCRPRPPGRRPARAVPTLRDFVEGEWKEAYFERYKPSTKKWASAPSLAGVFCRHIITPPLTRLAFETCVDKVLVPELRAGDIVVMDNLSSHKGSGVRESIEAADAELLFLPPCSPDLNPIEKAFSRLKALLRKAAERTEDGLWAAIARILQTFAPQECRNYVAAAGYDPG